MQHNQSLNQRNKALDKQLFDLQALQIYIYSVQATSFENLATDMLFKRLKDRLTMMMSLMHTESGCE